MSQSRSEFVRLRGLRLHVRRWGDEARPALFLLHGWFDVSASFEFLVQPLLADFQVLAPDWRGFGLSEWPQDGYWFPDYIADLEALLDHYGPQPQRLIGHSMGGQAASLYAGLRPQRLRRLALLDTLLLPDTAPELAPARLRQWLDELRRDPVDPTYDGFDELAARVRRQHPRLDPSRALFVARCWGAARADGRIGLLADPRHRRTSAMLYRAAESKAVWREVSAPTLFLDGADSPLRKRLGEQELAERRACFRDRREIVLADCGHMLHFDAPQAAGEALRAFFLEQS